MRDLNTIDRRVMWLADDTLRMMDMKSAIMKLPSGTQAHLVIGTNEDGWEHVSVMLRARRLPTWEEMSLIKDIFWDAEEEVVQIHPKHSHYVNMVEALHLWRPCNGDWSIMNEVTE
jgi:hypothetical protein